MKPWTIGDCIRLILFATLVPATFWLVIAHNEYMALEEYGCAPVDFVQYLLPPGEAHP